MSDVSNTTEPGQQIDLLAFIREEHERVDRFAAWWREQRETEPEHFPLSLPPGEWDEQFRMWGDD